MKTEDRIARAMALDASGGGDGYTKAETDALLAEKVDQVSGKGLSTEDYTSAEKSKLAGIASGAEVNVQADWSQSDSSADDYIKNKPTLGTAAALNMDTALNARSGNPVENSAVTLETGRLSVGLIEVLNSGAKNRLDPNNACGYDGQGAAFPITVGGVTFTLGSDGMITTSGTPTAAITLRIPVTLPVGAYFFSGCPYGGSSTSYRLDLREPGTDTLVTQTTDEGRGIYQAFSTVRSLDVCLRIAANYVSDGTVFRPMVCTTAAAGISQDFVKYCPSMAELYEMIQALQA
ncbi:MAG: hypothetical protein K5695_05825 [Oscillospiraceae bacterium]|nr:hypothetical protein [Oscillospiraceae bacterium]